MKDKRPLALRLEYCNHCGKRDRGRVLRRGRIGFYRTPRAYCPDCAARLEAAGNLLPGEVER